MSWHRPDRPAARVLVTAGLVAAALAAPVAAMPGAQAATPEPFGLCAAPRPGHAACFGEQVATGASPAVVSGYGPADLEAAYAIPDRTTTATVAIVDAFGDSRVEPDLGLYRAHFGLPGCTRAAGCLTVVNQDGRTGPLPPDNAGWAAETALDVEMVSAVCPSCHILLVQADSDALLDLADAVRTATRLGARYVSMSWGATEWAQEVSGADPYTFAASGVVYVAASGDAGYGTGWPAANPRVVSVGGTSLYRSSSNPRGFTERVWSGSSGATASGCSAYEPRPAWQYLAPLTSLCPRRAENDVAILADPQTGVAVVNGSRWGLYGGTSAGAPMIAALYAMAAGAGRLSAPALLYAHAHDGAFLDITSGASACSSADGALCRAASGWDGPTGLGVPRGLGGFTQVDPGTVTVHSPGSVTSWVGAPTTLTATARNSQGRPVVSYRASGLPRGVRIGRSGLISGTPASACRCHVTVTATDTLGTTGRTSFAWTVRRHRIVAGFRPHLRGIARPHHVLRVAFGGWHRDRATGTVIHPHATFRWFRDGHRIAGATGRRLRLKASWRGHRISVRLTGWRTDYIGYRHRTAGVRVR